MKEVKLAIIGGGSRLWAIQFLKDVTLQDKLKVNFSLYDIEKQAALNNVAVGNEIFKANNKEGQFSISVEDTLEDSLKGADFVIITIEPGIMDCRYGDLVLPEQYGILQTVGDTTGPGGIMRARRALPIFFEFGKAIEKYCPNAWVINYTNPMTLCTAALYKAFPQIKALGCCHEVFHVQEYIASLVGEWFNIPQPDRREIKIDVTGINHFTFITKALYKGEDLMPRIKQLSLDPTSYPDLTDYSKDLIANEKYFTCQHKVALSFLRDYGALGAAGDRHLAEFVPFYLQDEETPLRYGFTRTPYEFRVKRDIEKKQRVYKGEDLIAKPSDEEGLDILLSLMGERTLRTNINRPNLGQISYLPKGRIVESNGFISENSIEAIVSQDPPVGVQNLVRRISDEQEVILNAIWDGDDERLFEAFLTDPLVNLPRDKARELFDKMMIASELKY